MGRVIFSFMTIVPFQSIYITLELFSRDENETDDLSRHNRSRQSSYDSPDSTGGHGVYVKSMQNRPTYN